MRSIPLSLPVVLMLYAGVLLQACNQAEPQSPEEQATYTVTKVLDGDSLVASGANQKIEIRLFGIDAPEYDQPYSRRARAEAKRLLVNKSIHVEQKDRDRYGRVVAVVYIIGDDTSVNAQLVERGAAWVYRRYTDDNRLIELEKTARLAGRGLWALPTGKRLPPWEWRQQKTR